MGTERWVFMYGSNMCRGKMIKTISGEAMAEGTGRVRGFEVVFNKESQNWDFAANIVAALRKICWGVVYKISEKQYKKVRDSEKGYEPMCVEVMRADRDRLVATTFVALKEKTSEKSGQPRQEYLDFILQGGIQHGVPRRYLRTLMGKARRRTQVR